MDFTEKLQQAVAAVNSTLCVGLDPNLHLLPQSISQLDVAPTEKVETFLKKVIDVTRDYCAAYKPNLGFFEALGADGWDLLEQVVDYIPDDKIIIADAKRGDISSTADHYAKAFFEQFDVDALTLNPLMGFETLEPFLNDSSKGIYVLTLTSNPGAKDILLQQISDGETISTHIARQLNQMEQTSETSIGMVVGATQVEDLRPVIGHFPKAPLLIPGVGKQGGSVDELAAVLQKHTGIPLINSSRSIIYAGSGSDDDQWEQAVARSAKDLTNKLSLITQEYV